MKPTAIILMPALVVSCLAGASDSLPPGVVRSGNVISMQPITGNGGPAAALEHHPGTLHRLPPDDHDLYVQAFEAGDRGDWPNALGLAARGPEPAALKILEWRRLLDKNSGASFADIDAFAKANPDWPLRNVLIENAEAQIGTALAPAAVVAWFGDRKPVSVSGHVALGEALVATGADSSGREEIRRGWREGSFDPPVELAIVEKDGRFLRPEDDRARLDNLLWHDQVSDAKRELSRLDDVARRVGEARIALRDDPQKANALVAALPVAVQSDAGLLFDRARNARRQGDNPRAEALLLRIASREPARDHPDEWWCEFNVEARQALEDHEYKTAFNLASTAGLPPGQAYSEAEFLAGWIALRHLSEPNVALSHFQQLDESSSRPISRARARYWEGRAYETLGKEPDAFRAYQLASVVPEAFYGQLALAKVTDHPPLHVADAEVEPTPRTALESETLFRPMQVLAEMGEQTLLRILAFRSQELHPTAQHANALMKALTEWGFPEIALRLAKEESYEGNLMLSYSYPVIALPVYAGPQPAPEPALVLGLIRQETEFDAYAVSGPGARGLMQLMPDAAQRDAGRAGLAFQPDALLSDTNYNMQLGMTELSGYLTDWNGSFVLAAASYNAGLRNVDKWLAANGDPRSPSVDPVDWIESIPFSETRNYVQRVLENTEIYRNRLAARDLPLRIASDLYPQGAPVALGAPSRSTGEDNRPPETSSQARAASRH